MSSVLLRKRNLSTKQFFIKALDIQVETARLAHKESVVPKSYRFTFGVPMCEAARSMVANIEHADAFYPNTSWGVIERKKSFAMAIADANTLYDLIACLIEVRKGPKKEKTDADEGENEDAEKKDAKKDAKKGSGIDLNELHALLDGLDEEIAILQGAKNGVKIIGKESEESRLEAAEAEAQRLRDLILIRDEVRV